MSLFPSPFDTDSWETWIQQRRKHFWENSLWNKERLALTTPDEVKAMFQFPKLSISQDKSKPLTIIDKDGFTACVDIQHFKPDEITVKTINNTVIVEAKHEDREDEQGFISRSFYRKYILPAGYDPKLVVSALSSDGILTIKAPKPVLPIDDKERLVQVQQTGPSKNAADSTETPKK